jgi:4-amino-4-deoxy-L-arabinose transferase-like glycosyltransferase
MYNERWYSNGCEIARMTQHAAPSTQHLILGLIVVAYLIVGGLFAVFNPAWQAPDEPPHYNYIAAVARAGCCPVIQMGDWDQAYQTQLTTARFAPELLGDIGKLRYENHQPPLYYLIAAPVYKLTGGGLTALRLFSVLIGAGVVLCAYGVGVSLLLERPHIALAAAAWVAFLPQHVAMLAAVNNDGLAEVVIGLTLIVMIRDLKAPQAAPRTPVWLGILIGIGLLTKVSTLFLAGLGGITLLLRWRRDRYPVSTLFRNAAWFALLVLLLGGIWWLRNIGVYGFPDIFGLRRHDQVVADQLRTRDYITRIGVGAYLREATVMTFQSFWGVFGWMALPMPAWIYRVIQAGLVTALAGLALEQTLWRGKLPASRTAAQRDAWLIVWLTAILAALAFLYYNTEFVQYQGRYLFPGLIPVALWLALGADAWRGWLAGRWTAAAKFLHPYLTIAPFAAFALLDIYLLWRVIVPGLKP